MKRTIRLTEADLHNIVRKCINEVIEEGQGWDMVKNFWGRRGKWMNDPDMLNDPNANRDLRNWVDTGDIDTEKGGEKALSYNPDKPAFGYNFEPEMGDGNLKRTNHSLRGKIGRRAAGAAIKGMHNYGKMRNAIKNGFSGAKKAAWQS